ncbi:MAG: DUF2029 domain-containing protein [Methylobacteriaceae bacterium]|jgi:hypothetical protein|nr:DUF2029 domain-containing protein [Methylobacteriaceae bacterium]
MRDAAHNSGEPARDVVFMVLAGMALLALVMAAAALPSLYSPPAGAAPGTVFAPDYLAFWAGGSLGLDHQAPAAYDAAALAARQTLGFGAAPGFLPFLNPPPFLLLTAPLAVLAPMESHYAFAVLSLLIYGFAAWRIFPDKRAAAAALAFPAVFFCLPVGQTGLLTAGILGLFTVLLGPQPFIAGLVAGTLVIKPQLAVLVPFVLMVSGNRWAFAGAAVSALGLCLLASAAFGFDVWPAFFAMLADYQGKASSLTHYLSRMQTAYGLAVFCGASAGVAALIQAAVSAPAFIGVLVIWKRPFSRELKYAALIAGTVLVTPYFLVYEFPIMAMAGLWLWRAGVGLDRTLIVLFAAAFLGLFVVHAPVYGVLMGLAVVVIVWRARREQAAFGERV